MRRIIVLLVVVLVGCHDKDTNALTATVLDHGVSVTVNLPRNTSGKIISLADDDLQQYAGDADALFAAAIAKVQAVGAQVLYIPADTYVFTRPSGTGPHIDLSGLEDVTIQGNGATLRFMDIADGILITRQTQRLWIKDLTLDWGVTLAFPGNVVADSDATPVFKVLDGYPIDAASPPVLTVVCEFDLANRTWVHHVPLFNIRHVATNTHLIGAPPTYDAARQAFTFNPTDAALLTTVLASNGPSVEALGTVRTGFHAIDIAGAASDITLDHVTVYTSPGMAFIVRSSGRGFHCFHCADKRNPDDPLRMISSLADAFNIGTAGDIIIEESEFADQEDDGLNVHGQFFAVTGVDGASVSMSVDYNPNMVVGDDVIVVDAADFSTVLEGKVVTFAACDSGCDYQVTLDTAASGPLPASLFVMDANRSGNNFIVRNNSYHDNHASGIKIQGRNGVVVGNSVQFAVANGIRLQADLAFWLEGPGPQNVMVASNAISDTGFAFKAQALSFPTCGANDAQGYEAALHLDARLPSATGAIAAMPLANLVIDNNSVSRSPGLSLLVASVSGATVSNNTITDGNQQAFLTSVPPSCSGPIASGSIYVTHADGVTLQGNSRSGEATADIVIDPSATNVSGKTSY